MSTTLLFRLSLILKGIDALLEVLGGILLLLPLEVDRTIAYLLQHELYAEVNHHLTTAKVEHVAALALQQATVAAAVYLIVHGSAKVILIGAVFKEKRWGYIGLVSVLGLFTVVELVRFFSTGQMPILALGLFDALIVFLIGKEYKARFLSAPLEAAPESTA